MRKTNWSLVAMLIGIGMIGIGIAIEFPLVYVWFFGLLACLTIFTATMVVVGNVSLLWCILFGRDFIEAMFSVIGSILSALLKASTGSSSD